eukprot:scaffold2273_cov195-Skeletonema_marinoi.AAC.7
MDPPAATEVAAPPPPLRRQRRGAIYVQRTLLFTISFSILSLLKLEPLARNSVQNHNNEIDMPHNRDIDTPHLLPKEDTTQQNEIKAENFLPRVLAFVFPQFHKDSLNDRIWGERFTDWDSLRNAPEKNRLGFKIPRPTELGYYNYSEAEPRRKQGELANQYGIDGFIFHHYWFNDEAHPGPNLHEPLVNMLKDGYPDVPFALHWCAQKWIVTWNAKVAPDFKFPEPDVLQTQKFPEGEEKIKEHYDWLKQFFHHPNYIKVDGKPLFLLYEKKRGHLHWLPKLRELAKLDGFPGLYFVVGISKPHEHLLEVKDEEFEETVRGMNVYKGRVLGKNLFDKVLAYPNPSDWAKGRSLEIPSWCTDNIDGGDKNKLMRGVEIAGIINSFDNTPRRNYEDAHLFATGEPDEVVELFRKSLDSALYYEACCFSDINDRLSKVQKEDDRFIVINAMNEWGEGMALEPSDVYGRKFLETIRDTKDAISKSRCSR